MKKRDETEVKIFLNEAAREDDDVNEFVTGDKDEALTRILLVKVANAISREVIRENGDIKSVKI